MMSAMNRLNSRGDKGSPCLSPTDVVNGWPSLAPSLMREGALIYMFSTSLQNCGPSPHIIIFRNRRGRLTLSYAFWRSINAAYSGCPMYLAWSIRVLAMNMWSVLLLPLVKAPSRIRLEKSDVMELISGSSFWRRAVRIWILSLNWGDENLVWRHCMASGDQSNFRRGELVACGCLSWVFAVYRLSSVTIREWSDRMEL